jgi:hypothetical protein
MANDTLVIVLALATLGLGLGYGIWQIIKTRRASAEGRKSAMTKAAEQQDLGRR